MLALLFFLALIATPAAAQANDGEVLDLVNSDANPLQGVREVFSGGNYLAPLRYIEEQRERYDHPVLLSMFDQLRALWLSYVGDVAGAEAAFGSTATGWRPVDEEALSSLLELTVATDAVDVVRRMARGRRFVVINEAHHAPETRMLTAALLDPLWKDGFRYLALESIAAEEAAAFRALGRPRQWTGGYLSEPAFAELVRRAMELGYRIIPYEDTQDCASDPTDPEHCLNQRDEHEARNLLRAIRDDPEGRVLVHCGYSHLTERTEGGWKHMAQWLGELSHDDPLTVDQTRMRGHLDRSLENPYRSRVADRLTLPTVFLLEGGRSWVEPDQAGAHDVTVFLPGPDGSANRQPYLSWYGLRQAIIVASRPRRTATLVQAFHRVDGDLSREVPADQFLVQGDAPWELWLPPGRFVLQARDRGGKPIAGWAPAIEVSRSERW